jgi:hypothetical protein
MKRVKGENTLKPQRDFDLEQRAGASGFYPIPLNIAWAHDVSLRKREISARIYLPAS